MTIKPINYNLTFEPDLEKFTFKGREIIAFELREKTKQIILDAVDLKINKCTVYSSNDVEKNSSRQARTIFGVSSFKPNDKKEKLIINFSYDLKPGQYQLEIEFEGILNDKLAGFYRSKYSVGGKEKYLATTQFEARDARRAFPCIDHPSFKATFDVSMVIDKNLTAISNTLQKDHLDAANITEAVIFRAWRRDKNSKKLVVFERTPLMSTYLLYLGVGEFEFLEDMYTSEVNGKYKNTSEVKKLRVVTTSGKSQYGKFALECAKKSLEYFENYFAFPFPLKKLDLIAIPESASGAMENWGAMTFRENALLYYPEKSSKVTRQRIAEVIAHEIAHQWFGNLVTMKWWDDLWLNESFATYMANKALDHYWPEWSVWDQYLTDTVFEGMALDSLKSSHPIKVEVKKISEIDELFDEIAYDKGGSLLRMLNLFMGEGIFKKGLRKYIQQYKYANAQATDLWNSLEKNSEKPVRKLMKTFVQQVGFPEVEIELKNNNLTLKQSRFLFDETAKSPKQEWIIPYHLDDGRHRNGLYIFDQERENFEIKNAAEYLFINKRYAGFYISNYSADLLEALGKNIGLLNNQEKIGIIHDLFALIMAGKKDLKLLYQFTESYFKEEKSELVLHYLISKLTGIYLLLGDKKSKEIAEKFSKGALESIVGYEVKKDENIVRSYLRNAALSSLTLFDNSQVKEFVKQKFEDYLKKDSALHPDLRGVVFSGAVWFNDSNHRIIKNLCRVSDTQEEKAKLLMALSNSKNKKLIKDTLNFALGNEVPFSFIIYIISPIGRNPFARKIVLDWLFEQWSGLMERSGGLAIMLMRRILQSIIPISGIGREAEIEKFLNKNKMLGLERSVEQTLEKLKINSRFVKKYKVY